jgi:hypothetical protein
MSPSLPTPVGQAGLVTTNRERTHGTAAHHQRTQPPGEYWPRHANGGSLVALAVLTVLVLALVVLLAIGTDPPSIPIIDQPTVQQAPPVTPWAVDGDERSVSGSLNRPAAPQNANERP